MDGRRTDGLTPLMSAAAANPNPAAISTLAKAGADINARDRKGQTALGYALATNANPEVIQFLLHAGADAKYRDLFGNSAFDHAQQNSRLRESKEFWELNKALY